jgi:acyl carrier protein
MDEQKMRLENCFLAVFPELSSNEVSSATSETVPSWDSVAGVTLMSVVEEEFGIVIQADDLSRFTSFQGYLGYLDEMNHGSLVGRNVA